MSLSGLVEPAVDNAYKSVQEERGGWFLLSYVSRDTVEVHAQGVRGVHEMRDAAQKYYDSSMDVKPLFGIAQFRRRRVVIKLVPENTSLLFKARVQVHWLTITTRFANHDLAYEITSPAELDEHLLTQHIELHSGRSSAGSTRKPKLDGIEEDAEEASNPPGRTEEDTKPSPEVSRPSVETVPRSPKSPSVRSIDPSTRPHIDTASLIERSRRLAAALEAPELKAPEIPEKPPEAAPEERKETQPKEYPVSVTSYRFDVDGDDDSSDGVYEFEDRRTSSQTARPTTSDQSYYSSLFRPKVKVGPRPSTEKRTPTSKAEARPVASLPAGLRAQRPAMSAARPKSRDSALAGMRMPPPPPIPEMPMLRLPPRPGSSSASVKSLPATLPKSPGMTPEKARLMKFRDMYRQREAKAKARASAVPEVPPVPVIPPGLKEDKGKAPVATPAETPADDAKPEELPEPEPAVGDDRIKSDSVLGIDQAKLEDPHTAEPKINAVPDSPTAVGDAAVEDEKRPEEIEAKPILNVSAAGGTGTVKEETPSLEEPQPTPSGPPSSIKTASSPISALESPAQVSTRPTSISDSSTRDKSLAEDDESENADNVDTPSTVVASKPAQSPASQGTELGPEPSDRLPSPERIPQSLCSPIADHTSKDPNPKTIPAPLTILSRQSSETSNKVKRNATVGSEKPPLTVSTTTSEADYDEDLMDELDTAQVHEATPISVSKTPIMPVFSRQPSTSFSHDRLSSTGTPPGSSHRPSSAIPSPMMPRSPSGTLLSGTPQQQEDGIVVAKKMKIETGIAAKIADLQRSFSRGSPANLSPSPNGKSPEASGSSFIQQRATALRSTPPRTSSAAWQQNRPTSKASFSSHGTDSPERERAGFSSVVGSRINVINQQAQEKPTKPDTISVTATIVRTDRPQQPTLVPPTAGQPLELLESPLTVTQNWQPQAANQRHSPQPQPPSNPQHHSRLSVGSNAVGSESTTSLATTTLPGDSKEQTAGMPRRSTDSQGGWRLGRRTSRSENKGPASPVSIGRTLSSSSLETMGSGDGAAEQQAKPDGKKKGSRASRLMRRMSSSMSSIAAVGRLPLGPLSPQSLRPEDGLAGNAAAAAAYSAPISPVLEAPPRPAATDIGDLNVQFPDTLLWKRRWVEIDAAGAIVLKPYGADRAAAAAGVVKRFHLSEFEPPFAPDLERQEMPHSVILDFKDGRTLQLSCASPAGQKGVLQLLADSYFGWKDVKAA